MFARSHDSPLETRVGDLCLKNPVMLASGTAGYGSEFTSFFDMSELGAVVVKSLATFLELICKLFGDTSEMLIHKVCNNLGAFSYFFLLPLPGNHLLWCYKLFASPFQNFIYGLPSFLKIVLGVGLFNELPKIGLFSPLFLFG